eukprot:6207850-Pleurochrysis_carterae.AAC.3
MKSCLLCTALPIYHLVPSRARGYAENSAISTHDDARMQSDQRHTALTNPTRTAGGFVRVVGPDASAPPASHPVAPPLASSRS